MIDTSSHKQLYIFLLVTTFTSFVAIASGCSESDKGSEAEDSEVMSTCSPIPGDPKGCTDSRMDRVRQVNPSLVTGATGAQAGKQLPTTSTSTKTTTSIQSK